MKNSIILGYLSVKLRQNTLSALRDALAVIHHGIEFLVNYDVEPPQQCETTVINNLWIAKIGDEFYKSIFFHQLHQKLLLDEELLLFFQQNYKIVNVTKEKKDVR